MPLVNANAKETRDSASKNPTRECPNGNFLDRERAAGVDKKFLRGHSQGGHLAYTNLFGKLRGDLSEIWEEKECHYQAIIGG